MAKLMCLTLICFWGAVTAIDNILESMPKSSALIVSDSSTACSPEQVYRKGDCLSPEQALAEDLKDSTVSEITLLHNIELTGPLPPVTSARNLTITGNCTKPVKHHHDRRDQRKKDKEDDDRSCRIYAFRQFNIFSFTSNSSEKSLFTLTSLRLEGAFAQEGAAVLMLTGGNGVLYANNVTFAANHAVQGGAAIFSDSALILNGTTFAANTGGALRLANPTRRIPLIILQTDFSYNPGGAIFSDVETEPAIFINTKFAANSAPYGGAAIRLSHGKNSLIQITDCNFATNMGVDGGALFLDGYRFNITHSTFTRNKASGSTAADSPSGRGGAIFVKGHSGMSWVKESNIDANAANIGGGIYGDGGALSICFTGMYANFAFEKAGLDNVAFQGDAINIYPFGGDWHAAGSPVSFNYDDACTSIFSP
eukprot:TRINITY_DN3321_c0_g2_i1.p1 TRINITY_DN3321_c0_g2~~TRINITY_DN3321_c0_g2_i1.p1  ORF type:complete len:431 (-),score=81.88 TRINITY_DN3321_c0_g2_i1:53-1324(-)